MDISPEYVKMCEKAEEIQELTPNYTTFHKPYILSGEESNSPFVITASATEVFACEKGGECKNIWLPRQDQLQEMLGKPLNELLDSFLEWEDDAYFLLRKRDRFTSMEQLWLAFVMKEKYGKTWDGENWVKGGDA